MSQKQNLSKGVGMIVGVFAAIGVGLGLTGYISVGWIQGTFTNPDQGEFANSIGQMFVGLVFLQSVIITFFTGPTVAAITGLLSGLSESSRTRSAGIGGLGSFVGFYVMVVVAIVVMSLAYGSGGGSGGSESFDMGQAFVTAAKAGIPTAIVGVIAGYLGGSFDAINVSLDRQSPSGAGMSDD